MWQLAPHNQITWREGRPTEGDFIHQKGTARVACSKGKKNTKNKVLVWGYNISDLQELELYEAPERH